MKLEQAFTYPQYSDDLPLIFVPGFMASRLWRPRKGLLRGTVLVWPLNIYNLITELILLEEEYPLKAEGLVGRYYDGLLEFISRPKENGGLGRRPDENFWVFAYDWRQSSSVSGKQLHHFITEKLAEGNLRRAKAGLPPWQQVDIINHSMGGFVTRAAMIEHSSPVRRVVYLASGHYGTAKAFFALHPDTLNVLVDDFVKDLLPGWYWNLLKATPNVLFVEGWLARVIRTFQSVYELLPDQFYLEGEPGLITDATKSPPVKITGVADTYYRHPWQLPVKQQTRVRQAMRFKERLGRELPGAENLVIYSATQPTYATVKFDRKLQQPERLTIGDLTVIEPSANQDEKAARVAVDAAHTALPNLPETHEAIRAFLH